MKEMEHPRNVEGYASFDDLVDKIIEKDHVRRFLEELADDISRQADGDSSRGRTRLAGRLYNTSEKLYTAAGMINQGNDSGYAHDLVGKVGNMQYDCIAEIIEKFAERITRKGLALLDEDRKRCEKLVDTAENIAYAQDELLEAWKICEKYMRD